MFKFKLLVFTLIFAIACQNEKLPSEKKVENKIKELSLDQQKKQKYGIETCEITKSNMPMIITASGVLDVPPQNAITISPILSGFIKNTNLLQGMKVSKGQVIAEIQSQEFINLQQEYLENKSQLEYLEAEYKRQENLSKDNINSQKIFSQAKSNYFTTLAKYKSLKAKLEMLKIDLNKVNKGEIESTFDLKSDLNGYVSEIYINIGKFVSSNEVLFRIVNTEHIHAELKIFEKDIPFIKIGQEISFNLNNEKIERKAEVHLIGKEISQDKTLRVHCHLKNEDHNLIPGTFIKALIHILDNETDVLPNEAVVKYEGKSYVFIEKENNGKFEYKMQEIQIGNSHDGKTAILSNSLDLHNSKIVSKGAYKLLSQEFNENAE